jgi:urease subunit alpha
MSGGHAAYGPSTGDRVALGDTGLIVEVEHDSQAVGEEFTTGFARPARDGMHLLAATVRETCDLVVTNVLVLDPVLGVRKASIGIREGRISAIGRAGNPHTLDGVEVVVGTGTAIVSGEGLIATAGAIDTHVHLLSPRVMEASLASGVTSIIGQEFGPVWGVGVNSPWALRTAFSAFDAWPVNIGFLARGSSSHPGPLVEALAEGGACGCKVHEDMGAHARASTRPSRLPKSTTCRWRCTPTASTRASSSRTHSRSSTAAPSTRSTSRAAAAGTPLMSSASLGFRT